jgi:hypothetical protein
MPDERLAVIVSALESAGLRCLVMGGHAVRFYGLERITVKSIAQLAITTTIPQTILASRDTSRNPFQSVRFY